MSSGEEDDDDEVMVKVGKDTAPGTPVPGQKGMQLGQRLSFLGSKAKDPVGPAQRFVGVKEKADNSCERCQPISPSASSFSSTSRRSHGVTGSVNDGESLLLSTMVSLTRADRHS